MVTDAGGVNACLFGFSLDHPQRLRAVQPPGAELLGRPVDAPKERACFVLGDVRRVHVLPQIEFKGMVAGHFMVFAAFFMEPYPKPVLLGVHVFDVHRERRADAGEAIRHERNQGTIAEVRETVGRDGAKQVPASSAVRIGVLPLV